MELGRELLNKTAGNFEKKKKKNYCYLKLNVNLAAKTDNLNNTIDYQQVYQVIAKEMEQSSSLLENVAYRILTSLQSNFPMIKNVRVSIKKMNPPLGGKIENVSVEMNLNEIINVL